MPTLLTALSHDLAPDHAAPRRNPAALALALASSLLAPFGAYGALIGCFLVVPILLFGAGTYLLVHYWRAASGTRPRRHAGFWSLSLAFNLLLLALFSVFVLPALVDPGGAEAWPGLAAMVWQGAAARLSLAARDWETRNLAAVTARPARSGA